MNKKNKSFYCKLEDSTDNAITALSEKYGISKSRVAELLISRGLDRIIMKARPDTICALRESTNKLYTKKILGDEISLDDILQLMKWGDSLWTL